MRGVLVFTALCLTRVSGRPLLPSKISSDELIFKPTARRAFTDGEKNNDENIPRVILEGRTGRCRSHSTIPPLIFISATVCGVFTPPNEKLTLISREVILKSMKMTGNYQRDLLLIMHER